MQKLIVIDACMRDRESRTEKILEALLAALVLKDALLFLCPSHTQLSTMTGSSYLDLGKQAEYPLALMSSRHSSRVFLNMAKLVGLPVFPSKIRAT